MPIGIESAGGVVEKTAPLVHLPLLMRVVCPGILATAVVYPFTAMRTDFLSAQFSSIWRELVFVLLMVVVLGAFVSALSGEIYKIYEGRILWPTKLFERLKSRQQARVDGLHNAAKRAKELGHITEHDEIWYKLRAYPLDPHGVPYASRPTMLGNILSSYEDYPWTRYRMDAVFYWPRLWLQIDKDKKEEIDKGWCIADGFLNLSAIAFCGGATWMAAGLIGAVVRIPPYAFLYSVSQRVIGAVVRIPPHAFPYSVSQRLLVGCALLVLGYAMYRLSLPFHRLNGETFKATFDIYRDKIRPMTHLGSSEISRWQGTWSYLQYLRVQCMCCGKYYPADKDRCDSCGYPASRSLDDLKHSSD
jgi:hypothetical protein